MTKDQIQKDLEQEAKNRSLVPTIDEAETSGEATYKRNYLYRLTIHNKDYAMGSHYPEDDWTIVCYGKTVDELIKDAAEKVVLSRICWDWSEFSIVKRIEFSINGEKITTSEIEVRRREPEPTTQVGEVVRTLTAQGARDAIHKLIKKNEVKNSF